MVTDLREGESFVFDTFPPPPTFRYEFFYSGPPREYTWTFEAVGGSCFLEMAISKYERHGSTEMRLAIKL